ncbi:hypothetical protein [Agaribacter flavus]|uniref:Uncharacterized protein n=1 Tax=Agaribacter flavus TaxID=1902781 RepID=A0ABV7FTT2_9ALTE
MTRRIACNSGQLVIGSVKIKWLKSTPSEKEVRFTSKLNFFDRAGLKSDEINVKSINLSARGSQSIHRDWIHVPIIASAAIGCAFVEIELRVTKTKTFTEGEKVILLDSIIANIM